MSRTPKWLLVISGCLIAFVAVAYIQGWFSGLPERAPSASAPDLSNHPIYSKYKFGEKDNVIDVGMQPLSLALGVISGTMKRDRVLKKALSEQGLEIRLHPFFKGADVNFFLKSGDLDVAMAGDMPAIIAATVSDVVIAAQNRLGFNSIVAGRHMLIKDLRGKRIGYVFGSNAHYTILQAISSEGLRETDVYLVQLNINEMSDKLAEGHIDAFAAWEPTPTIALSRFDDFVIIHRSLVSTYLYFSRSLADRHPGVVQQIIASQLRSIAWMKYRQENLFDACSWAAQARKDFTGKETLLSTKQCASLIKSDLLDISQVSIIPERDLAPNGRLFREFAFLKGLGKIPETADWAKVRTAFDRTIIYEVISEAKQYKLDTFEFIDK